MKIVVQLFYIPFFYMLGMGVSVLSGGVVPGSVIGMLLLFVALLLGWVKPESVQAGARTLLDNMMFFFLPACVGLMSVFGMLGSNWLTILVAVVVSTLLVIVAVALTEQRMENRRK